MAEVKGGTGIQGDLGGREAVKVEREAIARGEEWRGRRKQDEALGEGAWGKRGMEAEREKEGED